MTKRNCTYCGIETETPCGFLNESLGCTDSYYVNQNTPARQGPSPLTLSDIHQKMKDAKSIDELCHWWGIGIRMLGKEKGTS